MEIGYELYRVQSLVRRKKNDQLHQLIFCLGLTRLKSLSLHNNQFSALPSDIIRLDLQELSLRNNPLLFVLFEI